MALPQNIRKMPHHQLSRTRSPSNSRGGYGKRSVSGQHGHCKRERKSVIMDFLQWLYKIALSYVPVNCPIKLLMTAAATWFLSRAVIGTAEVQMAERDIVMYSSIYCGWAIFFLPDILLHVSGYILGKLFWLLLRLFLPELIMSVYLHCYKGESNVWQRALSMRPMMSPEYQWLEEMIHSARFTLIVGCLSASLVANMFDRPEILIDYVQNGVEDEEGEGSGSQLL